MEEKPAVRQRRSVPKKILLAISKPEVRAMLGFAVESRTGEKPIEAETAKQAIEALADHGAIRVLICEYPGISDVLFRHIVSLNRTREEKDQIRCVVCCAKIPEDDQNVQKMNVLGFVLWGNLLEGVTKLIAPLYEATSKADRPVPESDKELTDIDTCRIRTTLLIRVGQLRAGIYIRLSATKYVKLFQEGDEFSELDYKRILRDKNLEHLYLRKNECSEFLIKFKNDLLVLLQSEILPENLNPELLVTIHETAQELLQKLGATEEVQAVIKTNVQLTVKAMENSIQLSDILKRINADRDKYISSHSILLPQVACALAIAMDWKSDATLQKISLAAFLHDMPMQNHALAAVTSLTELTRRKDQFTEEEMETYRSHPVKASEMAKRFHEVPPDVDTIILQHHERPDGSGFPRGLSHQYISPLGAVFIVAHDLVSAIFDQSTPFILEKFIESKKKEYYAGNFKKLLGHLGNLKL